MQQQPVASSGGPSFQQDQMQQYKMQQQYQHQMQQMAYNSSKLLSLLSH